MPEPLNASDATPGGSPGADLSTGPGSVAPSVDAAASSSEPLPPPLPLCASDALAERGRAWTWDVRDRHGPVRAFALRFDGRVVAYLNRCAHVATEMDWQEGEFLDMDRRWIVCAVHGAAYEPLDGLCVAGPCAGARLTPLDVREERGVVTWYPSRAVGPADLADPASTRSPR